MGQSSELPTGILDLEFSETENSLWSELLYREGQAEPTLPPILRAASVMVTPQNVQWTDHRSPSQFDRTPSYSAFVFQRKHYYFQPRYNRLIGSFHLLTMTLRWARTVHLQKYKYSPPIPNNMMGNCATKQ